MKARVLIVDDSALARRNLRQILESANCEVDEAEDGLSALERYFLDKPDVVLLDLVMRGMYGLDVLEKLRQLDPLAKVVVVSADVQTSSQQLVDQAGAKAFITKPFDREEIIGTLKAVLGGTS
ncbi:MAG TPA: response regulator [Vicinamibacterales bacterium]|jgi:Response regulator containing CheY-like receiver, AAA-type ATPase, and DNA-binding domains|nr:response regulator [Vicinamibacterales bacterium]